MKTFLYVLFLFLLVSKTIIPQWYQQTSGATDYLGGVSFTDVNNGIAVGWAGTILRTTNGGTDWTMQTSGTTYGLEDVYFTDLDNGTIVGGGGTILRTTDGGTTWSPQSSGTTAPLSGVSFTDINNGTIVGGGGTILRTTNGGTTWTQQSSGTTSYLRGVCFIDVNTGTVVGVPGTILKTTDGGTTWNSQQSGTTREELNCVFFTDENNGTIGGHGVILRTTDGGTTWTSILNDWDDMLSVVFTDLNNGTIVGEPDKILRTTNGGTTWIDQFNGSSGLTLIDVYFTDANNGWIVGDNGLILRTTNGGGNPVPLPIWTSEILVEDAGETESSCVLTIGQDPNATDSIDASLGEYELPPPPFPGNFDARFNLPTNPEVGSLTDFRDSSLAEITWKLTFQPGLAGYPMTFSWDTTSFPEGTFYLRDRIDGRYVFVNMKNQSSYVLTEPAITSLNISYRGNCSMVSVNNYWNMLSVPLLAEDMALSNLYPTATSLAYGFDGSYVTEDTLSTGVAYWLKFDGNEQIQICGSKLGDTVQVGEGWNMFGAYEIDIPISQITTTPPGIIATYFFGFNDGYEISDTLRSGKGYWVRVTDDGSLNLNSGGILKDGEQEQLAKIDQNWGKIKITDNEDKGITLYAAEEEIESNLYELPPMPPSGIFDARYISGKFVENLSSSKVIRISSGKYPMTIKAEGIRITVKDRINGKILNEELNSGEEIRITNSKITSIEVTGRITGEFPISYELYQNYPNPFNPRTTIKFAVPKESNINLSIYNVLGELVSTLVNEQKKPGYYEYKFDASHYASGVYLYRIKAGDFTETKKMVLLR